MTSFAAYLLESAACLALFYVGFWLFLRKETYFKLNRVYLVCSLFVSLILPVFKITSPIFTARTSVPMSLLMSSAAPVKTWGLGKTLLLLYAIGVGVFLARFIFHMVKLYFVGKKFRITRINGIRIVSVDKDFPPFSFLNYIFINDKKLSEHNMRRIIAHEIIHIKQYHTFDILFIELITVLQWFNPFVWPYKKSLQETHEFLADYGVIAQGFSAAKYQLLIFEQHVGVKLFEFVNNFKQSQIKRRITMMSKIKSRGAAKMKLLLVVPMAAFLLLAFAEPKAADTPAEDKATLSIDQDTDQNKEEKLMQKKMEQVKVTLEDLKKEKMILRQKKLKQEYQLLSKKADAIRAKMEKIAVTIEKSEVKAALVEVLKKQDKIEAYLVDSNGSNEVNLKIDDLKKQYNMLEEKAEDLRKQIKNTDDPDVKAKCKQMLADIQNKQRNIKEQAETLKDGKEGKKIK